MDIQYNKAPEINTIENDVFYSTFGNNTRLELKNSFFKAGKLTIGLQKFDNNNKQIAYVSQYMDIEKALGMADDILSGRINQTAKSLAQNAQDNKPIQVYKSQGGQTAEKAKRSDHKPLYREFTISKGKLWMFKSAEGPGKLNPETKGIVKDGEFEKQVVVGASPESLREFALMIKNECLAYRIAQYVKLK